MYSFRQHKIHVLLKMLFCPFIHQISRPMKQVSELLVCVCVVFFFQCKAQVIFNEHMMLPAVTIREPSTLQCKSRCYFKRSSFHVCNHSTVSPKAWCRIH